MSDTKKPNTPAQGAASNKKTETTSAKSTVVPKSTPDPKVAASTTGSAGTVAAKAETPTVKNQTPTKNLQVVDTVEDGVAGVKTVDINTPEGKAEFERLEKLNAEQRAAEAGNPPTLQEQAEKYADEMAEKNRAAGIPEAHFEELRKEHIGNFLKGKSSVAPLSPDEIDTSELGKTAQEASIEAIIRAMNAQPDGVTLVAEGHVIDAVQASIKDTKRGFKFQVDNTIKQSNPYGFYFK